MIDESKFEDTNREYSSLTESEYLRNHFEVPS